MSSYVLLTNYGVQSDTILSKNGVSRLDLSSLRGTLSGTKKPFLDINGKKSCDKKISVN